MNITRIAVKRKISTSVIVIALMVLGIYGFVQLPVNFLPDITYPMIRIHVWWRGATPDEIITNIAEPIERQMATVDGLDSLESSSIEGMYTLVSNFRYGVNVDTAYQDAFAAMARVARQLPKDIDPPIIIKADPSQLPVVQLTISSEQWDMVKLRTWVDNWLQEEIISVQGVAGTEIVGGLKREIRVQLDIKALEKYKLSLPLIIKRLQDENIDQFAGRVISGKREFIVRTKGEYKSLDEIRSIIITSDDKSAIYLRDIANVSDTHEEIRVITRLGAKPCIKLSILKQADANTVEVALAVSRKIKEINQSIPKGIVIGIVENQADYVLPALMGVRNAALEATILVILIIYLFLGSFRQVLVMLMSLPLTLLLNFGLMKLAGFSLNIFSLGGLVVAIGVVLDNSIVVLENITRLQHNNPEKIKNDDVIISGTDEVRSAILAATVSFCALFFPFLLVPGLTSLLFRELILVIAGIVLISLCVAITVTPMFAAIFTGNPKNLPIKKSLFERFFEHIADGYGWILTWAIKLRWIVVAVFIFILTASIYLVPKLNSEFLPQIDDGRIMIKLKLSTGSSVYETDRILSEVESKLEGESIIESYFTLSGGKVWGLYTYEIANEGEINIQLMPRLARKLSTKEYINKLRSIVGKIQAPGGKIMVMQTKMKGLRKLGEADIEIKIKGQELEKLFDLAKQTAESMNKLKQFTNVYVSLDITKPEYQVNVDRIRASELGVSVSEIASTIRSLISGFIATRYREGDEFYNVRIIIPEDKISNRQDIENLILYSSQGGYLRLGDIADVKHTVGPVEIIREDQVKQVIVRGDAANVSVGQALSSLKAAMEKMNVPIGYSLSYGGQAQMMDEMKQAILYIMAFAIFFSFIVLSVQFNSFKLPSLILGTMPFCISGMIYAIYLSKLSIGATVLIGLLVVVASTVNEGVLLLTFVEELRNQKGFKPLDAVIQAAKIRLRPRMMIALAIIVGFIPIALNLEEGGDMLQPMAVSAIGGIGIGIFVALFLLPCLYIIFSRNTVKI
ncbi:MAG: efflux RND transporter permease subunit [Desulfobacterales bacterium]|nr:efflux RND transporter permease subunit [Desulfobacterales bacterium]